MPESYAANAAARGIGLGPDHVEVRYDSPELVVLRETRLGRTRAVPRRPLRRLPEAAASTSPWSASTSGLLLPSAQAAAFRTLDSPAPAIIPRPR